MPVQKDKDGCVHITPNLELMAAIQEVGENLAIAFEVTDAEDLYAAMMSVAIAGFLVVNGNQTAMLVDLTEAMIEDLSTQIEHHAEHPCKNPNCAIHAMKQTSVEA